jgi:nucleotide-binding universal stress UspA family protein
MSSPQSPRGRIVAGVDGSPSSREALQWAVRQARLTGSTVDAVIAWHFPVTADGFGMAPVTVDGVGLEVSAAKTLADVIAGLPEPPGPGVTINQLVVEGNTVQMLLDAAAGADLLVLGSRGHGGFTAALLGSVSLNCVHHAPCPVVIVRGHEHP